MRVWMSSAVSLSILSLFFSSTYALYGSSYKNDKSLKPYSFEEEDLEKGGAASKACRYDDAEWSDCEPFELIRYRVLHLLHGGRQCEEVKNISKHCTPEEFPPGVKWLIAEHRTCIAELKRLKAMIADLSKFIEALHEKGRSLLNAYLALKKHLDDLRSQISMLKGENDQQKGTLANLRAQIEEWKARARDLQTELDELKTKYHDLQVEHKEMGEKLKESRADRSRCLEGNDRLRRKIHELEMENSELKRRLLDAEKYKDQLREAKYTIGKLEYKVEKLQDQLEQVKDRLAQCKLDLLNANSYKETQYNKDTHVDLAMDMWITHNKSKVVYSTVKYTYPTTVAPKVYHVAKCLITYYGYTNETCWYQTKGDASEAGYAGMLGQHLVEAHWKYFTIDVKDAYECDKAAHLHYEFLLNRCSPKHYLPVISIFRPDENAKELTTHIYPKPNVPQPGQPNRCWVTFLGAHGQCEAHMDKYPLYNSDDTPDGYKRGSSSSKNICLSRRDNWQSFCKTPVIVTYLPDGLSTSWDDGNIMHDSHGGNKINPESINPHDQSVRRIYNRKSPDEYEDTPEYRKSLNMKGTDREGILMQLRRRLGITNPKYDKVDINANPRVAWHGGRVDIIKANGAPPPPVNVGNGKDAEYHAPPPAQLNPYTGMKPPQ